MNRDIFLAYLRECLAPTLVAGDIVIMDNLPSHKVAGVRETIEAAGAKLIYLPPYSPDLNPIEMAFSKLRGSAQKGRRANHPRAMGQDRRTHRRLHPTRMRQLLQTCRICLNSNRKCSRLSKVATVMPMTPDKLRLGTILGHPVLFPSVGQTA